MAGCASAGIHPSKSPHRPPARDNPPDGRRMTLSRQPSPIQPPPRQFTGRPSHGIVAPSPSVAATAGDNSPDGRSMALSWVSGGIWSGGGWLRRILIRGAISLAYSGSGGRRRGHDTPCH